MVGLRPLDQQVVVLTGASSGIGLSTARLAAQRGARLVFAARNETALRQLCDELDAGGERRAVAFPADVSREEDVARVAETAIAEFGRFDTWVNNAGVSIFGETTQVTIEDFRRVFDVVFWSVVYGSRQAVAHYRSRADGDGDGAGGAVVDVGSLFGDRATPLQSTYGSAKHALHGFTDSLRMELAYHDDPIAVTLVHPGRIDTPCNEHAQSYLDRRPAHHGVVYPPDAVAQAIVYSAAHGPRDMFVGSQAKITALAGALFPRLVDRYMEHHLWPSQMADDRPSQPRETPTPRSGRRRSTRRATGCTSAARTWAGTAGAATWLRRAPTRCARSSAPASARWGCWRPGPPAADLGTRGATWLTG